MKIHRVRAHEFGKLDGELDLAPGMTVIHGDNEAGKSTWLQAIFAGLLRPAPRPWRQHPGGT